MENLVPFYIDINWSVKKKKKKRDKKRKNNPTNDKSGPGFFSLLDGLFLSGELIIRSQISDQLEN